jgi:hypothetical protein
MQKTLLGMIVAALVLTANLGLGTITFKQVFGQEDRPKFKIIDYDTFVDSNGFLNVVGFIMNTSENAGMVPTMKMFLLNKQDETIYKFTRDPSIPFLNPESMAPFKITVTDATRSKQTANFKITFDQKFPAQQMNSKQVKLIMEDIRFSNDDSTTTITGDIKNDGSKATDAFTVAVAFMDEKNKVLDVKSAQYNTQSATGGLLKFSFEYDGRAEKYCLVVDSRYYIAEPSGQCDTGKVKIPKPEGPKVSKPSNGTASKSSNNTSSNPAKETIKLTKFRVLDTNNTKVRAITVGQQILLQSTAASNLTSAQPYAYIVHIKDEDGITVKLEWVDGSLSPNEPADLAIPWVPEEPGKYDVTIFIWKNFEDPSPFAEPIRTSVEVKEVKTKEIKEKETKEEIKNKLDSKK